MSEEEIDMEFLRMIGRYLSGEGYEDYEIKTRKTTGLDPSEDRTLEDVPTKWVVKSTLFFIRINRSIHGIRYMVCEDINGKIDVETSGLDNISDRVIEVVHSLHKKVLEKLKDDKERRSKLIEEIVHESFKIQNELTDRKNWDKYFSQKPFERVMRLARCGEEAAKKASEEFEVEVIHWMPHTPEEHNHFYSIFDSKGMNREKKFEEVKKRIDAVCRAVAIYYRSRPKYHKSLFYG